ncbi:TPA: ead/Ea22-like family protein [Klebsiella pneumoniae]|nr:ead/Ea22-like family protein [Klebsiella pneumoniae]
MTDITELAQSLKAAAKKATPGQWERGDGKHGGELLVYCDDALGSAVCEATSEYNAIPKYQRIDNLDFIALANPANILSLAEALEKAQQRFAELESRTVKLPEPFELAGLSGWSSYYHADEVDAALIAAGIKVEAE